MHMPPVPTTTFRGPLGAKPLPELVAELGREGRTGTLRLVSDDGQLLAAMRFQRGLLSAALVAGQVQGGLLEALLPLCAHPGGSYHFTDGQDAVGTGAGVLCGPVTPVALIARAIRGPLHAAAVDAVIEAAHRRPLKLRPNVDLRRYGFDQREQDAVEVLRHRPLSYQQLLERTVIGEPGLRRIIYALRVTRDLTLMARERTTMSGTVEHDAPLPEHSDVREQPSTVAPPPPQPLPPLPPAVPNARAGGGTVLEFRPLLGGAVRLPPSAGYSLRGVGASTAPADGGVGQGQPAERQAKLQSRPRRRRPAAAGDGRAAAAHADSSPAERHYLRAQALLRRNDYAGALVETRRALALDRRSFKLHALQAWLLYLRHGAAGGGVHERSEQRLLKILSRDPACDRAHYYLGCMYKRADMPERALTHFESALLLVPDDLEVEREVRLLEQRHGRRGSPGWRR
ncbi:MAG: tetratricopeptide repeat protein [Myxococcales bacterium]|nr:tetratricopeptide repeat protein [Myxococcales bacterium]